jgi:hypothetical protein
MIQSCPAYSFILSDVALFMLLGSDKITWKLSNFGVTKWSVITTLGPFAAGDDEQQSRQQQQQ